MSSAVFQLKHVQSRVEQGVLVLTLVEPQVRGDDLATALADELLEALARQPSDQVVLDFRHVVLLATSGFRPLLQLRRVLNVRGGRLILCELSDDVAEVLSTTRLITSSAAGPVPFVTAPTLADALAQLNRGAAASGGESATS
jgi:anti-anti-sigma factor